MKNGLKFLCSYVCCNFEYGLEKDRRKSPRTAATKLNGPWDCLESRLDYSGPKLILKLFRVTGYRRPPCPTVLLFNFIFALHLISFFSIFFFFWNSSNFSMVLVHCCRGLGRAREREKRDAMAIFKFFDQ